MALNLILSKNYRKTLSEIPILQLHLEMMHASLDNDYSVAHAS